jgi:XTP/dITP diphosphohydrolase
MSNRKLTPGRLVIASHNAGKVAEIRTLLAPYGVTPISAAELGLAEPEETGSSFAENALLKAHAACRATGEIALADDSGLCVAALNGAPGLYTADWSQLHWYEAQALNGERQRTGQRDWYLAMGKVEGKLAELGPDVDRSAYFIATLALVWPDGQEAVFEGRVHGQLVWPPRGAMGFGYDPVFQPNGAAQTFAEITAEAKALVDHRADAFAKLVAACF